jgi:hypothetical protein
MPNSQTKLKIKICFPSYPLALPPKVIQFNTLLTCNIGVKKTVEKTLLFIGEKQSGKSSLIAKYLDEPLREKMPKTTALDYRYGLKKKSSDE